MRSPSVFISYSHKDEEWKDRLVTHLGVLEQTGVLDLWEDRRIEAGDTWHPEIVNAINKATVAILMISANFLTSKFILSEEVPQLLERREKEGVRVIPVIVKPCAWTRVQWLSKIQARPKDGRALSAGNDYQIDTDLSTLAEEVARIIDKAELEPEKKDIRDVTAASSVLSKDDHLEKRIKHLINFGDYEKAINECNNILSDNPNDPLINLLVVVATLKKKGADRYQTRTIERLEKNLSNTCDNQNYYPTALVIWGLIKYDHYKLNGFSQGEPSLDDLKEAISKIDLELIDLNLIEKIKASESAYKFLDLLRLFPG